MSDTRKKFGNAFEGKWCMLRDMDPIEAHDLFKLRQNVFILEQTSLYQDIDGRDPEALHLIVHDKTSGVLVGTIRLMTEPETVSARIGRVAIAPEGRGTGLGRKLMEAGIEKAEALVEGCSIDLSAQAHLEKFYKSLGFETISAIYLEDGIPHVDMIRRGRAPG
ncbi:GNAT family N-acetyltransferase [uncultured Roseibium sp.]|uniref:GNAT family N-acetyltransferase n=1 Tax=uncultured Roseibium sp. TaxID=1936171 RepID=UPI0026245B36|nr:GNAT family N-acetyltransferase [uncultured Roseibium sp.]